VVLGSWSAALSVSKRVNLQRKSPALAGLRISWGVVHLFGGGHGAWKP
jgi:hypothetical protein